MKKAIITVSALALALAALAQDKPAATPPPTKAATTTAAPATATNPDPVIISAGTVAIHRSDFEIAVKSLPAEYQQYALGPGKKQFADDYLRMRLLASEGMKAGLQNDAEVVNQLALMRENLVATAQSKKIDSGITVSDAEVQKAYADNKKDYEQVKARHILLIPDIDSVHVGSAQALADSVRKLVLHRASFDSLQRALHDPSAERQADNVPADKLPEAYAKVIGQADSGTVVPVFQLPGTAGTHQQFVVLQVTGRRPQGDIRFEDVRERIRDQLGQQLAIRRYIDRLRQSTYVEIRS